MVKTFCSRSDVEMWVKMKARLVTVDHQNVKSGAIISISEKNKTKTKAQLNLLDPVPAELVQQRAEESESS